MKLVVAATAPFGADVLERLAAQHDVAALLTRPDRPAGRGRKFAAPPAKLAAERLGIPVLQPDRPTAELELPADTVVVSAYGLLIPEELLGRGLWLNVHPSLLPRWRGAAPVERALMAGDAETGVTIHQTVKELDAGPIAAQRGFLVTPDDDAGAVYARAAELAVELLDEVLPEPVFRPQEGEETYAAKLEPDDRVLDLSRPVESLNRIRALSPHIGARAELHGRPVTIWRARLEDGELVPLEVQPDGGDADGLRRLPPRASMNVAPARRAAYEVLLRVFEEDAYADRALRSASASLDDRDRSLARQLAFGSVQRLRTLDHAIETLGKRPVRKLDPPVRAALRLGAYQLGYLDGVPRYAAVNESVELVRAAEARAGGPLHERRAQAPRGRNRAAPRRAPRRPAQALVSRLDLGALAPRPRRGGRARPDAGAERASTRRCQTCPGTVPGRVRDGHPERLRGRARRRQRPAKRGDLAAEPWLAARRALRRLRNPASGCSTSAPRRAGKATMLAGEVVAVEVNEARARELEENVAPARCGRRHASCAPTGGRCRPS